MRFFLLISLLLVGCKSINKTSDFVYHNFDSINGILVDEVHYDSQTNIYVSKSLINDRTLEYKEIKIIIKLTEKQKKELFNRYKLLNIPNPNKCIYDKSTGNILAKSIIRFYAYKMKWQDEECNIDLENKKFNHLWSEINNFIMSTDLYKKEFKSDFIKK